VNIIQEILQYPINFYHLSFHQRQTGDDHLISFIVSLASDWRRSFHLIDRFTSIRLVTIIPYHLSFHQRQTGVDHYIYNFTSVRLATLITFIVSDWRRSSHIIYRFTSVRLTTIISYHLLFHQCQTGDDHITLPIESTFSAGG
jgi:hypothetical protein